MKHARQEQLVVSRMSATHAPIGDGEHYGQVSCPFCGEAAVVLGPKQGRGFAWLHSACRHSQGLAAGAGYDITVLFSGVDHE